MNLKFLEMSIWFQKVVISYFGEHVELGLDRVNVDIVYSDTRLNRLVVDALFPWFDQSQLFLLHLRLPLDLVGPLANLLQAVSLTDLRIVEHLF